MRIRPKDLCRSRGCYTGNHDDARFLSPQKRGEARVRDEERRRPRIAKSDANNSHLTKTGNSIGTPAYIAPEQEMGKAVKQSDVFALAAA